LTLSNETLSKVRQSMAYIVRDDRQRQALRPVESRVAVREPHDGLAEALFTGLNAAVFLILLAAVVAASILYTQGTL
jgi:hypothetical protein